MNRQVMIIVGVLIGTAMSGQGTMNSGEIDSATYALYNEGKWDELVKLGRQALRDDIDYYYLRMRMGIAQYNSGKYAFSSPHFAKALEYNQHEYTAKSYYYSSLMNMGNKDMARRVYGTLTESQQSLAGRGTGVLSAFDIRGGWIMTDNPEKNGSLDLLQENASYAEQLLIGDQFIAHAGMGLNISPAFSIYASYTLLQTAKQDRYQYNLDRYFVATVLPQAGGGYRNVYRVRSETREQTFDGLIRQSEVYLNARVQGKGGFSLNAYGNALFISLDKVEVTPLTFSRQDTLAYNATEDTYEFISLAENDYLFKPVDTSFVNWVSGLNARKDFYFLAVDISASYSRLYHDQLFQAGLYLTYYPLGNLIFYGVSGGNFLLGYNQYDEQRTAFSVHQTLGLKLAEKAWIEGFIHAGTLRNMNIAQGQVIFNLPDELNFMTGLKLLIFAGDHLVIDLIYSLTGKSGYYYSFREETGDYQESLTDYQTHSIIGGISWNF